MLLTHVSRYLYMYASLCARPLLTASTPTVPDFPAFLLRVDVPDDATHL